MTKLVLTKPKKKKATTIRLWIETRDIWKAIARHFQLPMTRTLHQIGQQIVEQNHISLFPSTQKGGDE